MSLSQRARRLLAFALLVSAFALLWPVISDYYQESPSPINKEQAWVSPSPLNKAQAWVPPSPNALDKADEGASSGASTNVSPDRVIIPAIDVDANVQPLTLNTAGQLNVPDNYEDAGRWVGGPQPGGPGASVLAGHVDSKTGPAVFWRLRELRTGDDILFSDGDGNQFTYEVTAIRRYAKDAFPTERVYPRTDKHLLRLITCGGVFDRATGHYRDNLVVFARLASR